MRNAEVTGLTIYPVKSMKGITLDQACLTPHGLEHDRRFMVVRADGRFVTQRDLPRLALVNTALRAGDLVLSMSGAGLISIPADETGGERIDTRVWGDPCETRDQGEEVSAWLGNALESNHTLRLVRMAPGFVRRQSQPGELGENTHTFFADAAPFLIASESSLEALNQELASRTHSAVPMNRFRPNITVRGLEPFAEHKLAKLDSENYSLGLCHPCVRCVVTTIDQDTASKDPGKQPFRTLQEINPAPGEKPAPAFGQNAILLRGDQATIATGDRLSANYS